jgi:phospholipid/cholesterol/gamma-HCH transport system substrate-binding protein
MRNKTLEVIVGLFMVVGFLGLLFLAFQVSGLTLFQRAGTYQVSAEFEDIGSLKVRAPVQISGVTVGRVSSIVLDPQSMRAKVMMDIYDSYNNIPVDSSASIYTQGILGSNYIALGAGFEQESLKDGGRIDTTHSALILENLIGQLLFSLKSDKEKQPATPAAPPAQ